MKETLESSYSYHTASSFTVIYKSFDTLKPPLTSTATNFSCWRGPRLDALHSILLLEFLLQERDTPQTGIENLCVFEQGCVFSFFHFSL